MLVQASERRSFCGNPSRVTVRISSMPAAEVGETDPERTDPGGEVAQDFLAHLERGIRRRVSGGVQFSC